MTNKRLIFEFVSGLGFFTVAIMALWMIMNLNRKDLSTSAGLALLLITLSGLSLAIMGFLAADNEKYKEGRR